jgi:rieske iron-sulfur protein
MKSNFSKERRDLLKSGCAVAGAAALVTVGGSVNAFAAGGRGTQPQPVGSPERFDPFVFADGPKKGQEVKLEDIVLDAPPTTVQAVNGETGKVRESEHSTILMYRVAPDKIPADIRGDTWEGLIAYSAVCTHQGCMVDGWDAATKQFVCPCHKGLFDPLQGGENTGGPKTRALPQIPVRIHDEKLVVGDAIMSWIGVKPPR